MVLVVPFPFVPFAGVKETGVAATAIFSSASALVGLRYLIGFKKKKPIKIEKKEISFDFFYPIKYEFEAYKSMEVKFREINWKVVGRKALEVLDWVDVAVGWVPVLGDVFDLVDSGLHIAYDYAYDKKSLKLDLVFLAGAFIPGASAGVERVIARRFVSKLVKVGIEAKDAKEIWKVGKKYLHGKQMREDLITFFESKKVRSLVKKNVKYATQIGVGYSFTLKEFRNFDREFNAFAIREEVIRFASSEKLKKFADNGLHRVVFQHEFFGIDVKVFEKIEKRYGKFTKGVLLFRADKIETYEKVKLIDRKLLENLLDEGFERFTIINVNDLSDVEKIKNMIKYVRVSLKGIEKAEKKFGVESEYSHINFERVIEGEVGHYSSNGELTFSLIYIMNEEQEEYVVRHELMHGVGNKVISKETLNYLYKKYYMKYYIKHMSEKGIEERAERFASIALNEYMDLVNVRLWKEVGYKEYYFEHLRSLDYWGGFDLKSDSGIIYAAEASAMGVKVKVPNEYEDIYETLLKDYLEILK